MNNLGIAAIVLSLLAAPFLAVSAGDLAERAREREATRTAELDYLAEARRPAAQQRLLQLAAAKAQSSDDPGSGARRLDANGAADHAPTFVRIVINASGTSIFEGLGSPGTDVTLSLGPRVIGTAKPDAAGQWRLLLEKPLEPGDHRITSASKSLDQSRDLAGQDVRISIPEQFQGQAIVAYEAPAGPAPAIRDVQRQRAEDLAKAASEKFSEVIPDRAVQPRLAQVPAQPSPPAAPKAAPAAQRPAPPAGDTGFTAPLTNWLERSAKDYQDLVVRGLSEPAGGGGAAPAPAAKSAPSAPRPAPPVKAAEQQPAKQSVTGPVSGLATDPLDALTDAQTAVQDWLARANREYQAEIMRRLETPAPGSLAVASGEKPKAELKPIEAAKSAPGPSAAEPRAKAEEDRKRLALKEKELEEQRRALETKRLADAAKEPPKAAEPKPAGDPKTAAEDAAKTQSEDEARRQAEVKRQAEDAQRKAAEAKRIAEDAAKKQVEDARRRAEEITRQKNEDEAKRLAAEVKKLDEQRTAAQKAVDDEARRAREAADRAASERKAAEAQARAADAERDAALKAAEAARKLAAETDIKAAGEKRREAEAKAADEQRKAAESSRSAAAAQRAAEERARAADAASAEASKASAAAKAAALAREAISAARTGPQKRAAERELATQTANARSAATRAAAAEKDGAAKAEKARSATAKSQVAVSSRPNDTRIAEGSGERGPVDQPGKRRAPLDRSERSGLGVGATVDTSKSTAGVSAGTGSSTGTRRSCARAGRRVDVPGTYIVGRGDTLWEIADRHYRHGRRYQRIVRANRGKIDDPDVIEPCTRLWLP